MKFIYLMIFFLCLSQAVQAQLFTKKKIINLENVDKDRLSWGYFLGFNSYDFKFDYKAEQPVDVFVERQLGFNVGLIGDVRINDYFNIRLEPGLFVAQRNLNFPNANFSEKQKLREVKSTYVHIPLLLKISTKRINNFKPFIVGGVSYSLNLSSEEDNPEDNLSGTFRTTNNTLFYELGFGIDFYLFHFKFSPTIRGVFSFNDELILDKNPNSPWTGNINRLSTRAIFINFLIQ